VRRRSGTCDVSVRERESFIDLHEPLRGSWRVVHARATEAKLVDTSPSPLSFTESQDAQIRIPRRICGLFCCERDSCHCYFCTPELPCPVLKRTEVITGLVQCLCCKCTSGWRVCLFHFNSFKSVLNPLCVYPRKSAHANVVPMRNGGHRCAS